MRNENCKSGLHQSGRFLQEAMSRVIVLAPGYEPELLSSPIASSLHFLFLWNYTKNAAQCLAAPQFSVAKKTGPFGPAFLRLVKARFA